MTDTATDPRPAYAAATAWVHSLLAAVAPDQLDLPTPCEDFDVRALAEHLIAVVIRAEALATVATVEGQPFRADDHDAVTYAAVRDRALAAWESAPLDREVTVP
ncbi:hypothetical protein TPAU25S_02248 [Tsukamurella paurometabola]|nr:Uncharacterised protein [Tsukamurella paurometabola]